MIPDRVLERSQVVPLDVDKAFDYMPTGVSLEAGMRQLLREGYMHNRARLISASFLVRHPAREGRAVHEPWKLRENVPGYPTPIVDPS